jgi:hypothetical protein
MAAFAWIGAFQLRNSVYQLQQGLADRGACVHRFGNRSSSRDLPSHNPEQAVR